MVGVGLGVVGLGVGTALGFMAKSTFDKATEGGHCDEAGRCVDQTGLDLRDDAVAKGSIGTAVFIAGAALAVGGAILWITAPSAPDAAASARGRGPTADAPWSARRPGPRERVDRGHSLSGAPQEQEGASSQRGSSRDALRRAASSRVGRLAPRTEESRRERGARRYRRSAWRLD